MKDNDHISKKKFMEELRRYQKGSVSRRHFLGVTGLGTAAAVMGAANVEPSELPLDVLVGHLQQVGRDLARLVVVGRDGDRADLFERSHHMFNGREVFRGQPTMRDDHDPDHAGLPPVSPSEAALGGGALSTSRCLVDTCQPAPARVSVRLSASATER